MKLLIGGLFLHSSIMSQISRSFRLTSHVPTRL
jgi:hypothetical protein